jgi:hypothetical protein
VLRPRGATCVTPRRLREERYCIRRRGYEADESARRGAPDARWGRLGRDASGGSPRARAWRARFPPSGGSRLLASAFPGSPDPVEHSGLVERAALHRGLELAAQLEQMPPQPIHGPAALRDEIVAVIEQQPDLDRPLVEERTGNSSTRKV